MQQSEPPIATLGYFLLRSAGSATAPPPLLLQACRTLWREDIVCNGVYGEVETKNIGAERNLFSISSLHHVVNSVLRSVHCRVYCSIRNGVTQMRMRAFFKR